MQLTPITMATEYCREYHNNKFNKTKAYMVSHDCTYEVANSHCSTYHKSNVVQDALKNHYADMLPEAYKSPLGLANEAQSIYTTAKHNDQLTVALKALDAMAEYQGFKNKDNITIHNTQATINAELTQEQKQELAQRIRNSTSIV